MSRFTRQPAARAASFPPPAPSPVIRIAHPIAAIFAAGILPAWSEIIYSTDFDDFPMGDNAWAGFDGWVSNDTSSGAQAIDDGLFSGALGKTAALGFNRPISGFTTVLRAMDYDPAVSGRSLIRFQSLFGIEDSTSLTSFRRDDFFYTFYNIDGDLLASLRLSNKNSEYGIWRQDGSLLHGGLESDTGQDFIRGELHDLELLIDLAGNRWSAFLDNIPFFEDAQFNRTGLPLTLGPVAVEWETGTGTPSGYGDNWILVADILVESVDAPVSDPPLKIDLVTRDSSGGLTIRWTAHAGFDYQVEFSDEFRTWSNTLPGSLFLDVTTDGPLTFTDSGVGMNERRFYRLVRTRRIP